MNIFNSLGSNYDFQFITQFLFSRNDPKAFSDLKSYLDNKYQGKTILLYKGREAIELALRILNLPKGTVVAFNGFTCYAVYKAVVNAGYEVEYIDIPDLILNFSPESLKSKLKENPAIKILIIQNTLGDPCKMEEIKKLCKENEVILIEDLAHSIGAKYKNNIETGNSGDFTILSFSQDKMIDSVAGGALIIRNKKYENIDFLQLKDVSVRQQIVDRFYPFFTFIIRETYKFKVGKIIHIFLKKFNLLSLPMNNKSGEILHRLPNWYTHLIYKQFLKLEKNLTHRKDIASVYAKYILPTVLSSEIVKNISNSSNLRFPLFIKHRYELIQYLKKCNIFVSDIWYDSPIAPKKYMNLTNYKNQCPNAEKLSSIIINLPTHKNISENTAIEISKKINIWLKSQ